MDETRGRTVHTRCNQATPACLQCSTAECECPSYDEYSCSVLPFRNDGYHLNSSGWTAPISTLDSLRNKYIFKLANRELRARFWLNTGDFNDQTALALVPARLGENKALDNAIKCICDSEAATYRAAGSRETSQSYITALQTLQTALNDPFLSRRPETLAAANILYNHELYIDSSGKNWTVHANGLIRLLQFWGRNGIKTDLERFVLLGNIGTIFTMAVALRQPCFLAEPEWTEFLHETVVVRDSESQTNIFPEDVKRMVIISVHIPGLLCRYQVAASSHDLGCLKQLMKEVFELRKKLQDWRRQYEGGGQLRTLEAEIEDALTMPVGATYRMSAAVFVILSDYMLANLQRRCNLAQSVTEDVSTETFTTVNHWTMLASNAKIKWLALKQLDATSARACAAGPRLVMAWVLEPPYHDTAEVRSMRLILQDLRHCLDPRR